MAASTITSSTRQSSHPGAGRVSHAPRCTTSFAAADPIGSGRGGTVDTVFAGLPSWWRWTYPVFAVFWIALTAGKAVTGQTGWAILYGVVAAGWVALALAAFLRPQGWRR
jgi:hypothetical protein